MLKIAVIICLLFLLCTVIAAQDAPPPIGIIDFYGLRTLSESEARARLQIKEGDPLPASREEVEKRLAALPNVESVKINVICCEAGKLIFYVGVQEKGSPVLKFRPAPQRSAVLPEEIVKTVNGFYDALKKAVLKGDAEEDNSAGHSLMKNPEARAVQEQFILLARQNLPLLRDVLYHSANAEHRAIAAQLIAYSVDKRSIVKDLVYGMNDADDPVRNASLRALGIIAQYAANNPKKNIKVPVRPFIDLLDSLDWTDRNKASIALWQVTEKRDPATLDLLRKNALPSLIEMARWKNPGHSLPAFVVLGRIGGLADDEIMKLWETGEREKIIARAGKSR